MSVQALSKPPTTYTVKEGDTLFDIAQAFYGDGNLWPQIAQANGNLKPESLQVGQTLDIPAQEKMDTSAKADGPGSYIVGDGETLFDIAQKVYGDSAQWQTIYDANQTAIGDDPMQLQAGVVLVIPPAPQGSASASAAAP